MEENNKENQKTPPDSPKAAKMGVKLNLSFGARMRGYFLAGILVVAPLGITIYLSLALINFVDRKVTGMIPDVYNPETYLPFSLPGLGVLIFVVSLILIGAFAAGYVGRLFQRTSDRVLNRMPVIRGVYGALKQILETVLAKQSKAFREAVLVEYPRRGLWAIAFITGRTEGEVQHLIEDDVINIFLPTTPNPTSGFLLFIPKKDLIPLSMTVEEAIKMVISGGIVTPKDLRPLDQQKITKTAAAIYEDLDILREKEHIPVLVSRNNSEDKKD